MSDFLLFRLFILLFVLLLNRLSPVFGPGTSPNGWVSEIYAILTYVCVRSSDVVFYGRQIHFGEVLWPALWGDSIYEKRTPPTKRKCLRVFFDLN